MATPALFDTIYISPRDDDLRVFKNIVSHPNLGPVVKNLVWDSSHFVPESSKKAYFYRLLEDIRFIYPGIFRRPATPFHRLVNALEWGVETYERLYDRHQHDAFIDEGFTAWNQNALSEEVYLGNYLFLNTLRDGLRVLKNLRSVTVTPLLWEVHTRDRADILGLWGTPLMRSWDTRYARPRNYRGGSALEFYTMTVALRAAAINIGKFNFHDDSFSPGGLSLHKINEIHDNDDLLPQCLPAFRNLTSLKIKFFHHRCISDETKEVQLFPYLLTTMKHLKEMSLSLSSSMNIDDPRRIRSM